VLAEGVPALAAFRPSTRFARNGELTDARTPLCAGDEIALLPPVGGG
jgi:molybdopterin converting factor small subunit